MQIFRTVAGLAGYRRARTGVAKLGLVMTMGALHAGHQSLIARARRENTDVVVSIFVNPRQFGPNEDLSRYPRPVESDLALCRREGVDAVFLPAPEEIYPPGFGTGVIPDPALTERLCGLQRPGHFAGVATVVTKVLNLVQPDRAYFGQKDAQQVAVLKAIARDLNLPGEIVVCPIVRDADGLALSSRNVYLTPEERQTALALPGALTAVLRLWQQGEADANTLQSAVLAMLGEAAIAVEYVEVVDPDTLKPLETVEQQALVAAAVRVGTTRLIDNVLLGAAVRRRPIIAIDGPAGAGKSTIARQLATRLGFLYIDTGAMYRALTWKALQLGIDPQDGARLTELARQLAIRLAPSQQSAFATRVWVDGEEVTRAVRDEAVTLNVSAVSSHLGVRQELVEQQRRMGEGGGVILDGRDIGTHVFPDAELKIFLTASVGVRAARRAEDLQAKGLAVPPREVLEAQIHERDRQDSTRTHAPLRRAEDAIEVSTDAFTVEQTVEQLLELYRARVSASAS